MKRLEILLDDITHLKVDAIVNAANSSFIGRPDLNCWRNAGN